MATSWFKRLRQGKSRPAGRRRPARARLGLEALEAREVPTVHSFVDTTGVLQVSTDSGDDVTIDRQITQLAPFVTVNGRQFLEGNITNIQIQSGFRNVEILAAARPLSADGEHSVTVGSTNVNSFGVVTSGSGTMQNIRAPLSLGTDTIVNLDDDIDPIGRNVTLNVVDGVVQVDNMAPARISCNVQGGFLGISDLNTFELIGGRGRNTFNVLDTPAAFFFFQNQTATGIFTGPAGDTVNVLGTHSENLGIVGLARDSVHIGNNGNLDAIQGRVIISNDRSFSALIVDGSAARSAQNVTLSVSNGFGFIHGLAPVDIDYDTAHVSEVIVRGSTHRNTWTVQDTFANPSFAGTVIETGAGGDTVNVLGTTGRLDVIGAGGFDTVNVGGDTSALRTLTHIHGQVNVLNFGGPRTRLNVNGSGDNFRHSVTLDATAFQGRIFGLAQAVPITYDPSGVDRVFLTGGNAADQFDVFGTPAGTLTHIQGGSGNDLFLIGSPSNSLDPILGPVTVSGGQGGSNTLIANDSGSAPGHRYLNPPGRFLRFGGVPPQVIISFANIQVPRLIQNPGVGGPAAQDLALPRNVRLGAPATLSGQLVDEDPNQVLSLTVLWGDGSVPDQLTPDRDPFALTHTYDRPGVYTVHALWTDSAGRSNGRDLTLWVGPSWRVFPVGGPETTAVPVAFDGADAAFALLGADRDRHGGA
jgi:hypothetical protein